MSLTCTDIELPLSNQFQRNEQSKSQFKLLLFKYLQESCMVMTLTLPINLDTSSYKCPLFEFSNNHTDRQTNI